MGMKSIHFIRGFLIFLVALSLVLTWAIWTMPGKDEKKANSNTNKLSEITVSRKDNEVFVPTMVVLHKNNTKELTVDTEIMRNFNKEFATWSFASIDSSEVYSGEEYTEKLSENNNVELVFPNELPFGLFSKFFGKLANVYKNETFQRITISLDNPTIIHFYNDREQKIYSGELENADKKKMSELLNASDKNYTAVALQKLGSKYVYLPTEEVKLPQYAYMVETQPNSFFIYRLFDDTSEVKESTAEAGYEQFNDNISRMKVRQSTNILSYYRNRTTTNKFDLVDMLKSSFYELQKYENWPGAVHYFNYNNQKQQAIYRRYIEGYPIFSNTTQNSTNEDDMGATYITVAENGLSQLQVPLIVAQTPLSDKEDEKQLVKGTDILASLNQVGIENEQIEGLEIGYCWTNSKESSRVVDLEPSWYACINGVWLNAESLISQKGGTTDGL